MVNTLEDSSAVNRDSIVFDSDSDYDHMKCIFDSLPATLSREQREKAINLLSCQELALLGQLLTAQY
jgi:hypothetical protein